MIIALGKGLDVDLELEEADTLTKAQYLYKCDQCPYHHWADGTSVEYVRVYLLSKGYKDQRYQTIPFMAKGAVD